MANESILAALGKQLLLMIEPLEQGLESPQAFVGLLRRYGWVAPAENFTIETLRTVFGISDILNQAQDLLNESIIVNDESTRLSLLLDLLEVVLNIIEKVRDLPNITVPSGLHFPLDSPQFWQEFPTQLFEDLLSRYLRIYQPAIFTPLSLFGIIEEITEDKTGVADRLSYIRRALKFERLGKILDPGPLLEEVYGWRVGSFFEADKMLRQLMIAARTFGFLADLFDKPRSDILTNYYTPNHPLRDRIRELRIPLFSDVTADLSALAYDAFLSVYPITPAGDRNAAPIGIAIEPIVIGVPPVARYTTGVLRVSGSFIVNQSIRLEIRPTGLTIVQSGPQPQLQGEVALVHEATQPRVIPGGATGSHLEISNFAFRLGLQGGLAQPELLFTAEFDKIDIVFVFDGADSFIQNAMGSDPLKLSLGGKIIWSSKTGLHFAGSGGLEKSIPVHLNLVVAEITTLIIAVKAKDGELAALFGINAKLALGPLILTIESVGVLAKFVHTPGGTQGLLGDMDLAFAFEPPTRIGLLIQGNGFTGGGFLNFDKDNGRYIGVLELEFQNSITLKAIGLLTTRLPDGRDGFSLLIIITADGFKPIELGFGFRLVEVGGLLALNRTANVERLRAGIKDNTLRSILFPENIIANANRIISDLEQVFPAQDGRFIFGPMAKIEWGVPNKALLTIDLGLLIEVPEPVRLFILGVARAILPDKKTPLLQLQVNFLGVVDFNARRLSFDATLFDSKLHGFPLVGDMAFRLDWGNNPNFLLTVGGFHPAYKPPPLNLPPLSRLTIQLRGGSPRLTLETYFAITSNTVQFGAKLELSAGGKFNVHGILSFDVLFQFNPFRFIAEFKAKLALRAGSSTIASITLSGELQGPTPWHAKGSAYLRLCFFVKIRIRFDVTFGEARDTSLPAIKVLELLKPALSHENNWRAEPPAARHLLVSVKEEPVSAIPSAIPKIVVHPFGVLIVSQKVVPLKIAIQKVGQQPPSDGRQFTIAEAWVGKLNDPNNEPNRDRAALTHADVPEQFAPAQFFDIPDAQKLSRKSFEPYNGGIRIKDSEELQANYAAMREVKYELNYRGTVSEPGELTPDNAAFATWVTGGSVAASPLSFARRVISALAPQPIQVTHEQFAVVHVSNMKPVAGGAGLASEAAAYGFFNEFIHNHPGLEEDVQVVHDFEVNGS